MICRDSAVFVPKAARENILRTLHLAHHAPRSMIQNTKGRIYWPQMRAQIHQVYTSCVECSLHKISKTRPPNEASQADLFENFYPNSYIQCDYFDFRGKPYMTVVCVLTGYGRVFACKDKSTDEALKVIRQWVSLYGRCLEVRTDSGPGFRETFREGLKKMGINLNHSSCYSPQSNSHAERFVRSCNDMMQKNKHLTHLELDEYMLCINSQIQPEGQHSAVDRFLGRSVLNFIPNSFNDQFVWQNAIKARAEVRERRVNKNSRGCKEAFYPGQPVLLQDHISRK